MCKTWCLTGGIPYLDGYGLPDSAIQRLSDVEQPWMSGRRGGNGTGDEVWRGLVPN